MYLSNWKPKRRILQALSFSLLFQLIFPVFAHSIQSPQTGYLANVCTAQGYQQIWVSNDNNQEPQQYLNVDCSDCLLSHHEYEDKAFNVVKRQNSVSNTLSQVVNTDTQKVSNLDISVVSIRAPPSLAS